ncbi:MAG: indole-3-glycerol phosphate synthase TrpC [Muribaculaceae bacterium]|nr:indole-3-glycerol phosphate synthase TrpC [Muribaculaceae bacterium]
MNDILQIIAENKRREVEALFPSNSRRPFFSHEGLWLKPVFSLSQRLKEIPGGIIAEFKRRSPSKGDIAPMADVAEIVPQYLQAGAAASSILTDTRFFGGSPADLAVARTLAQDMPLLRKDFIISKVQIAQARSLGASAVLLIAAILSKKELEELNEYAHFHNMEALVEIHDIKELDKISFKPDMLGINNRNLSSFHTNIQHSFELVNSLPKDCILVAESGIKTPEDAKRLRDAGFTGFLIGEALMSSPSPGETLKSFINQMM